MVFVGLVNVCDTKFANDKGKPDWVFYVVPGS